MTTPWYTRKWVNISLHVIAWVVLFALPYALRPSYNNKPAPTAEHNSHTWYFSLIMNLSWVALFYLNALLLIPRFVYTKKYRWYSAILLLCFLWLVTQASLLFKLVVHGDPVFFHMQILFNFFIFLFIIAASTAFRMLRDKVKFDRLSKERETENLKTELAFLRSQVSPHFMFNVLNNMVALARKKSDVLEPSLIKLSSLLRYILYETDEQKVLLEKEIDYLQSYIDLQTQRFGNKVKVNVVMDDFDATYFIEPMLLIPFVENAFKHGTGLIPNAEINIELKAKNGLLQFMVGNQYTECPEEIKDKTSGIGLQNVKRRLNLLYKNEHTLLINKKDNRFMISLQLNMH